MKRNLLLFTLCAVMSAACSSSDVVTDPEATAELLLDCSLSGVLEMLATFGRVGDIIDEATGDDLDNVTITPTGTANEFTVNATFDTDGDQVDDVTITGTALFSVDPTGGFGVGDSVTVALTQTGSVAATFNIVATAGLGDVAITGTANFPSVGGCNVALTFPVATPLSISDATLQQDQQLAGINALPNFIEFQVQGFFSVVVIGSGATLNSDVTLDGSNSVNFTNVSLNGIDLDPTFITLPPGDDLAESALCMTRSVFALFDISDVVSDIAEALLNGQTQTGGDPFTATAVVGQANTFDVTLIAGSRTFTGRISYPGDPTAAEITGLATVSTWQISTTVPAGGFFFGLNGMSTATFGVNLDGNDVISFYGAGLFTEDGCTTTVSVSPNTPFANDAAGTGFFSFNTSFRDATASADVVVNAEQESSTGITFTNAMINDFPVPSALMENFAAFLD